MGNNLSEKEQREKAREIALKNLKEASLMNLATAYLVEKTGQYGEAGSSAIEQFKYLPAMQSENGSRSIVDGLLKSRGDGKRYTGNISEYKIINDCAKIVNESLGAITVQDVLELIGSGESVKENYKNQYLSDLSKSENKEDKEVFQTVIASYMQYLTDTKVSEALNERAGNIKGGLESILIGDKGEEFPLAA